MPKDQLPIEVHDEFRKANVLHTYTQTSLGEAVKHALGAGQHLLAAKSATPHGGWESECTRLFEGSIRTAQGYMQFASNMGTLKSAQQNAVLLLEGSLDGAANPLAILELLDEMEALRAIVEGLPKRRDGVHVLPGAEGWTAEAFDDDGRDWIDTQFHTVTAIDGDQVEVVRDDGYTEWIAPKDFYATEAQARAAMVAELATEDTESTEESS